MKGMKLPSETAVRKGHFGHLTHSNKRRRKVFRVALSIPLDATYGRQKVLGILAYIRKNPGWSVEMRRGHPFLSPKELSRWRGDGIIGEYYNERQMAEAVACGVPVVNTSGAESGCKMASVGIDNDAIGHLAADHLLKSGRKKFLFFGENDLPYAVMRFKAFERQIAAAGCVAEAHWIGRLRSDDMAVDARIYVPVLKRLREPVAVFGATDRIAFGILKACHTLDLHVPNEVAVVGCNNDEILCRLATPRLSSVDESPSAVGYHAAAILDSMMKGSKPAEMYRLLPPAGLRVRESSDVLPIQNNDMAAALRFIRDHSHEFIGVNDVMRTTILSRRTLEGLFLKGLGHGIYQEIQRVHIQRAQQLLRETTLSLLEIARHSGFNSLSRFDVAFRKLTGLPPMTYRRKHGPDSE